ncbi:hypothetical protein GGQ92_002579 [Gracilibacillus halotolerans]|uniref:Antigen I/II N-terminal domain-containing protein n=1 Tax=Gracilibacillus halotolerans TaxID=74386 RepID=A0A841RQ71_9BACI|nr:hypothetical protein [Gracilibacillus halotolerans]MBB6513763.1 hypothetical protein [Gracilibacillus halotolerans]
MKKILFILLSLIFVAACGSTEESSSSETEQEEEKTAVESTEEEEASDIEVDKNLLSVEIDIPANMVDDIETTIAQGEEEGFEITENDDGSLTYKMSKSRHKELMTDMRTNFEETFNEFVNSEEFPSIQDIQPNKDFTEFTMVVDKNLYEESFDGFASITLGMAGAMYIVFDGQTPSDDFNILIDIEDAETGEVFDTIKFPEDLNTEELEQ